jgi:hypothetical protein
VTGDRASLFYAIDQGSWPKAERLHEDAVLERQERSGGLAARTRLPVPAGNMFREELELFAACIREGTPCELSAHNGCLALAAVDAAIASARANGAAVAIDDMMADARRRVRPSLMEV